MLYRRLTYLAHGANLGPVHRTLVVNVVGLTKSLIGPNTPRISAFASAGKVAVIEPIVPAVTCSAQTTYLTGAWPDEHGIVGNGWYYKDDCEVRLWRQSDKLVQRPRIWDVARQRDPAFMCVNSFWWFAMYSSADVSVTPRPMYLADGRKLPDVWTHPLEDRDDLQAELGDFPLFNFWGPMSGIESSRWITSASILLDETYRPTLHLVYLPHLDYCLQKFGPGAKEIEPELRLIDAEVGRLLDHAAKDGTRVVLLSEYGISPVSRPIHINRALRNAELLTFREERGREILDCGASAAFAVADHQIAHVYVNDRARIDEVRTALQGLSGVASIYEGEARRMLHLEHDRAGDFVVLSEPDAWFTYYYWLHDARAPDFARTVDIHRKPGYDPAELFLDPSMTLPKLQVAWKLLRRKLGFRTLLDVIPLDATLVKGSHGARPASDNEFPVLITSHAEALAQDRLQAIDVRDVLLDHLV